MISRLKLNVSVPTQLLPPVTLCHRSLARSILCTLMLVFAVAPIGAKTPALTEIKGPNIVTVRPIYQDAVGTRFADTVTVHFDGAVMLLPHLKREATFDDINPRYADLTSELREIERLYGAFEMRKMYPESTWGDVYRVHRRTGSLVEVPDLSQKFELRFAHAVQVDRIAASLERRPDVKYAHGPAVIHLTDEPDDWAWRTDRLWNFEIVDAPDAWDVSKGHTGTRPIRIALLDDWDSAVSERHPDLAWDSYLGQNRLANYFGYYGDHGTWVASVAGAITDNAHWTAGMGWNVELFGYHAAAQEFVSATNSGADVINNSWISTCRSCFETEVRYALAQGVVVVGSAGNDEICTSCVKYPAAYHFPDLDAQVIAVSGTDSSDNFVSAWTCSPGTDPANDPANAFIDVAAPGEDVFVLWSGLIGGSLTHTGVNRSGTSFAAPLVSGMAALLLARDPTLTPAEVYHFITGSTEKVGQFGYDAYGWNACMGFGRVNAGAALRAGELHVTATPYFSSGYRVGLSAQWEAYPGAAQYRVTHFRRDDCGQASATVTTSGLSSGSGAHPNCGAPSSCYWKRATVEALSSGGAVLARGSAFFCEVGQALAY